MIETAELLLNRTLTTNISCSAASFKILYVCKDMV